MFWPQVHFCLGRSSLLLCLLASVSLILKFTFKDYSNSWRHRRHLVSFSWAGYLESKKK